MPRPTSTFGDFVTSVTNQITIPKIVDNILNGNFALLRFLGNSRPWPGGDQVLLPIKIVKSTSGGSYSGFDTLSTAQTSDRIQASVDPRQYYHSIVISNIQQAVNQGEGRVLDLLTTEIASKADDMKDNLGIDFYLDGTSNASKAMTGLVAAVDDNTSITTYEGISRATYTAWRSTRTAQGGALALANLYSDFNSAARGQDDPTVFLTTPAVFGFYEALLDDNVRYTLSFSGYDQINGKGMSKGSSQLAAGTGFNALYLRGVPFVADEQATAANLWTLNERHLWFYTFRKHPKHGGAVKHGFFWTGLKEPVNQDADVGQLLFWGNLAGDAPRTMARRTAITS